MKNIILGAGGHSKEVLEVLITSIPHGSLSFFNNIATESYRLFEKFEVCCENEDLKHFDYFYLGIGGVQNRRILSSLALQEGLRWKGVRSRKSEIGSFEVELHETVDIMDNVSISSSVKIQKGTLINRSVNIHHDVTVGEYCEIAPNAQILGHVRIADNVFIGSGAIILPNITIGANAVIGAGAVVTKDVIENMTVAGIPARGIKNSIVDFPKNKF